MKINHNIQALNAYRNLYQNQFNTSKNLERLSSGLRINRAADDAAGLAISEKMRSQIKGLSMAERNSLDGVSLMQVAEGAMNEVHSMLQRMRELSVQAANDTNTDSDRNSIQQEIDQLLKEIDSVAAKTEFNTRKLLDGSSAVDTQFLDGEQAKTNLKQVPTVVDPTLATGKYEVAVSGTPKFVNTLNQPGAGISSPDVLTMDPDSDLALGEYSVVVTGYQDDGKKRSANIEIFDPSGFSIGQLAAVVGEDGKTETIGTETGKQIKIDTAQITGNGTAKVQIESKVILSVSKVNDDNSTTPITFSKELITRNGEVEHGGLKLSFGANVKEGASQFDLTNKALTFQIGANTNQNLNIDIPQLSTVKLGINNLNILSNDDASKSIFKIDQAINQISSIRAKLGATQNRLEHTISNLQVTNENLTSAESRIRDTDMAQEMTEFTKNNILNQSAQAMLAQANQLPNGVLQLLQS